jgi:hypothetical protein
MYSFYKPRIKNTQSTAKLIESVEIELIRQINGENTWEEIFGELMIKGYSTNEINRVIVSFIEKEMITEDESSELNNFSPIELRKFENQLKFFDAFYDLPNLPFSKFNSKSLQAQIRIKNSRILLIHQGFNLNNFIIALDEVGFSNVLSYEIKSDTDIDLENISVDYFLETFGIELGDFDIMVFASTNFNRDLAIFLNTICSHAAISFLPYNKIGTRVEIGPFYIPNQSSCYNCFNKRNIGAIDNYHEFTEKTNFSINISIGIEVLLMELFKFQSGIMMPSSKDSILILEHLSSKFEEHRIFKLPRCKCCGKKEIPLKNKIWEGL